MRQSLINFLFIRWHQAKAFQQTPRFTRTEGSPLKPHTSHAKKTPRYPPASRHLTEGEVKKDQSELARTASTPYRLPRLIDTAFKQEKPKDYVYKQPLAATHFLLRKDPK